MSAERRPPLAARRRGGPVGHLAADLLRSGRSGGSWAVVLVLVLGLLAVVLGLFVQGALPWLVYAGL